MSYHYFEDIIRLLQLSADESPHRVVTLIDAVNQRFRDVLRPGTFLTLDESMMNSFHHKLKAKITCKPSPIGDEVENMSDAS